MLTFRAGEPLPPKSERELGDVAAAAGVPKRLAAACKALRERDVEVAHRHLSAFLKSQGHPIPAKGDREMAGATHPHLILTSSSLILTDVARPGGA